MIFKGLSLVKNCLRPDSIFKTKTAKILPLNVLKGAIVHFLSI